MEFAARWATEKNEALRLRHGVAFEDVMLAVAEGRMLADRDHPNAERYGHQRLLVVEIAGYAYGCPYVFDDGLPLFKTLYPSRALTRDYLGRRT